LYDVPLSDGDLTRFEARPRLLAMTYEVHPGRGPYYRMMRRDPVTQRCVALAGELGACRCTIYRDRPMLCGEFPAGSPECLEARRLLENQPVPEPPATP
jgi:Fe-S-cluster containining protein